MLDRATIATTSAGEFQLTVHRTLPVDWPSVTAMGEARAHVFQTREFLSVWAEVFATAKTVDARFVEVSELDGRRLMLVPLGIETQCGLKVLTFADHSGADYNAPLLYPTDRRWTAESARSLWSAIEAALPAFDVVRLEKMPAMVADCINPFFLLTDGANPESAHGSNMLLPWAEIEATQAQLKTLKRKERGLEKLGSVRFVVASTAVDRGRLLTRLLEQKQRRFEDTRVASFDEAPEIKRFFERATDVFADVGHLHLFALEVGDELIATNWSVSVGKTIYELMIGFEAGEWTKHSGGRILNLRFLEWAKQQGFAYVDHGIGDEDWKLENCDTHVPLHLLVDARSSKGRLALTLQSLRAKVRSTKLFEALRPYKWVVKRMLRR